MYHQIKPTEVFHERELALLEEGENRRLAWRLRARRATKSRGIIAAMVLGFLAALVVASLVLVASSSPAHASTTFTVNLTDDRADANPGDGQCSVADFGTFCTLRAAIQEANATTGADTINFDVGAAADGLATISPTSALPEIIEQVTIDGYSQPGASPNTRAVGNDAQLKIVLNGANAGRANGLKITSDNSVVRGLVVNEFEGQGIQLNGSNNKVEGNFIGTDPSGTVDLGNGHFGVEIDSGTNNTVGGTSPEARNLISGNDFIGVFLSVGSGSSEVLGNYIGTAKGGKGDLGNSVGGVFIQGAAKNTIGDGTAGGANTIAFNGEDGVRISNASDPNDANANRVLRNSIFSNVGEGIDLGSVGVTPNDGAGDADAGANTLQNFPVIGSAKTASGKTTIKGKLTTKANKTFVVRFFKNPKGNEGKTFIGQKRVVTDASGTAAFGFSPKKAVAVGKTITATTTGPGGNTSEFSVQKKVVAS
jgi:CSLREA domain-containing protein